MYSFSSIVSFLKHIIIPKTKDMGTFSLSCRHGQTWGRFRCLIYRRRDYMLLKKRKLILVATFLIIAAIALVLFVGYFTGDKKYEYEGTLVETQTEYRC